MSELGDAFATIVSDGSLLLAAGVAALVGLISFASPCVLPLVPGYLAYVAGLTGAQTSAPAAPAINRSEATAAADEAASAFEEHHRHPGTGQP